MAQTPLGMPLLRPETMQRYQAEKGPKCRSMADIISYDAAELEQIRAFDPLFASIIEKSVPQYPANGMMARSVLISTYMVLAAEQEPMPKVHEKVLERYNKQFGIRDPTTAKLIEAMYGGKPAVRDRNIAAAMIGSTIDLIIKDNPFYESIIASAPNPFPSPEDTYLRADLATNYMILADSLTPNAPKPLIFPWMRAKDN